MLFSFRKYLILILLASIGFTSVSFLSKEKRKSENIERFLFIGHTYDYNRPGYKIDNRLEVLQMDSFDGIWLGGDICSEALLDYSIIEYIDGLVDLSNPMTFWALGNHDIRNGNLEWLYEVSGKNDYNTHENKGIVVSTMNSNILPDDCENLDNQFDMIKNVCDTIQHASHYVLLVHHGIWTNVPGLPVSTSYAHSNLEYWRVNCRDTSSNNFPGAIYPSLKKVQEKGIQVYCVLGDMGSGGAKTFDTFSDDSIRFLGCGLYNSYYTDSLERAQAEPDYVLMFTHNFNKRTLDINFLNLDSLVGY